ncbi:MAG: ATP-dependent Clp protease ATP-binding subunit [Clostridia bacterium]|nr:ATP-dependent Clp protease ATP-binding subunit [Clostridia bacterium]
MLGKPDSNAGKFLATFGLDESNVSDIINVSDSSGTDVEMTERTRRVLHTAIKMCMQMGAPAVTSDKMLYAILTMSDSYAVGKLNELGCDVEAMLDALKKTFAEEYKAYKAKGSEESDSGYQGKFGASQSYGGKSDKSLEALDKLGVDLTKKAREGKLDPVIGRSNEIDRIIQILSRRTKNNPVLIGEPGVGKSAIVEGLAQAIVKGEVPEMLKDKKIFSMDMASVVAGSKYRGEFEEKLQNALKVIKDSGNIILFIDEIHTIVGTGSSNENAMDAANILKPLLARGEMQTIGATTIEEYRKYIEKDAALERRFQPIIVEPPSVEETITILKGLRDKYEKHHQVTITDEAITAAAVMSDRYISDRFLPDKAIDLIDEAASKKRISNFVLPPEIKALEERAVKLKMDIAAHSKREEYGVCASLQDELKDVEAQMLEERTKWATTKKDTDMSIGEQEIAQVISQSTSIPVAKLTESEADRLMHLEQELKKRVVGQDEAVIAVSKAVRRARAGIKDPNRPIGSFIFLGPTGVGKTELTKALAEAMFGDENLMIRVDMSEYMEKFNVSKLIGSAPGYVGFDEGGQLTEKVRRKPYSVVLFDEIEKAHPDVFNILLQILEDGRLTDSHGRTVSFKNTVVIMTSNIGAGEIKNAPRLGFGSSERDYDDMRDRQMEALKRTMKPEFINRIDDIIIFRRLEKEDMTEIAANMLARLKSRLAEQNIDVEFDTAAGDYVISKGYDSEYGARPLRRAVQKYVEDILSEKILTAQIKEGDSILVSSDGELLTFTKK